MICKACGKENDETAYFCINCGATLRTIAYPDMNDVLAKQPVMQGTPSAVSQSVAIRQPSAREKPPKPNVGARPMPPSYVTESMAAATVAPPGSAPHMETPPVSPTGPAGTIAGVMPQRPAPPSFLNNNAGRGILGVLPVFGVFGVVLLLVATMVSLYTYSMVFALEASLNEYKNQLTDESPIGQVGSAIMDFFTDGAMSQKREDVVEMQAGLTVGKNIMSVGVGCSILAVILGMTGVMRNIKRPTGGRMGINMAALFAVFAPVLMVASCFLIYIINTQLVVCVTTGLVAVLLLMVESQRIHVLCRSINKPGQ